MTWENAIHRTIGRKVFGPWNCRPGEVAEVIKFDPLGSAMTDKLLRFSDGFECWVGGELEPADGRESLPSRRDIRRQADQETLAYLQSTYRNTRNTREFREIWPGCEFAKTIVGNSLLQAIAEVERRLK